MPIQVCIVEDQNEIRNSLVRIIHEHADLNLVASFETADLAASQIAHLEPDVVIMDINMPGKLNGIECIKLLKKSDNKTQFMMFTIYEDDTKIFDAIQAGASGYLLKKTPPAKIVESIIELHHGGSPMNMNIARKVIEHFQIKKSTLPELTEKQNEILALLSKGYLYKEISHKLGISTGTVTQHIHSIYERLHVGNKTEAINKYLNR